MSEKEWHRHQEANHALHPMKGYAVDVDGFSDSYGERLGVWAKDANRVEQTLGSLSKKSFGSRGAG
jgi:hypothetical protein